MIKIDFSFDTQYGVYRDALYLDDNHSFTEKEIEAMKQARVDNWISVITIPSEEVIETPLEDIVE
jgi:hypothetical protein